MKYPSSARPSPSDDRARPGYTRCAGGPASEGGYTDHEDRRRHSSSVCRDQTSVDAERKVIMGGHRGRPSTQHILLICHKATARTANDASTPYSVSGSALHLGAAKRHLSGPTSSSGRRMQVRKAIRVDLDQGAVCSWSRCHRLDRCGPWEDPASCQWHSAQRRIIRIHHATGSIHQRSRRSISPFRPCSMASIFD